MIHQNWGLGFPNLNISDLSSSEIQFVYTVLSSLYSHKDKINLLLSLEKDFSKIAHFGCSTGYESIALAVWMKSEEIIAIDFDKENVLQAKDIIIEISQNLKNIDRILGQQSFGSQEQTRNDIDTYLKLFRNISFPNFKVGDMTNRITPRTIDILNYDYFNLAYCERVLYHIACGENNKEFVTHAIKEMVRVLKPGGILMAIEPKLCGDPNKNIVNLYSKFIQENLVEIKMSLSNEMYPSFEDKDIYLYRKPHDN